MSGPHSTKPGLSRLSLGGLSVARGERVLFRGLDLDLRAGQAAALTGPNGSGKTSLLRAVAGFIRPAAGAVGFHGPDGGLDPDDARGRHVHLLGHQDGLKPGRTTGQELVFHAGWNGGDAASAAAACDALELRPLWDLEVRRLSAGQRRRLAMARLLAAPRALWLLDEPMAPLDALRRDRFAALMRTHLAAGGMILAAVHDPLPIPTLAVELTP